MLHACQFCLAERRQPFGGCCYYCGSHLVTNLSRPGLIIDLSPRYKDHLCSRTTSQLIWLKEDSRNLRYRLRPNWNLVLQSSSSAENSSHFKDLGRRGRLPVRFELGPVRSGVHFSAPLPPQLPNVSRFCSARMCSLHRYSKHEWNSICAVCDRFFHPSILKPLGLCNLCDGLGNISYFDAVEQTYFRVFL